MPADYVPVDDTMSLDDGRTLAWIEVGDPEGKPLMVFHGTPGSRLEVASLHDVASGLGLRLIAPDRPGMGASTFQPGRTLTDWPSDVDHLVQRLGLDSYSVLGFSGGGPSALACGAASLRGLDRIVLVSGCGPVENVSDLLDTGLIDAALGASSRWMPGVAKAAMSAMGAIARRRPNVAARVWEADLLPHERDAVRGGHRSGDPERELASFREALAAGPRGAVYDYRLLSEPWDFLPEEVDVPVLQWHGEADAIVGLREAAELRTRLPDSELRVVPGAGHLLLHTRPELVLSDV